MASPKSDLLRLEVQEGQDTARTVIQESRMAIINAPTDDPEDDVAVRHAVAAIDKYLTDNAPAYRELQQLRAKVGDLRSFADFCPPPSTTGTSIRF